MSSLVLSRCQWLDENMRPRWHDVSLTTAADGTMRLQITLMGEDLEENLGDFDLEYWFDIPPQPASRGLPASLARLCAGNPRAGVAELQAHLDEAGATYTGDCWI